MRRTGITTKILTIALIVLLIGIILFTNYIEQNEEAARKEHQNALSEQIRPYRQEIDALSAELKILKDTYTYTSKHADLMIGFVAYEVSDLTYMQEKAEIYQFHPVLVIDCREDIETLRQLLDAADTSWEVLLYSPIYNDQIGQTISQVQAHLKASQRDDCKLFLFRSNETDMTLSEILKKHGMVGYLTYHNMPSAGQNENGTIYLDYSYLKTDHYTSQAISVIDDRMGQWYANKASMLCILDMSIIKSDAITEDHVTNVLNLFMKFASKENASFSTVADVVAKLSQFNQLQAESAAELEQRSAAIKARIEELKTIINSLYQS